jgi:glucose/arabinose dehydrogenase
MRLRRSAALLAAVALAIPGCGGDRPRSPAPRASTSPSPVPAGQPTSAPVAPVRVPVKVPAGLAAAPFDVPRFLNLPPGWSAAVYARIPQARFMSLTPGGELLVSRPGNGTVVLVRRNASGVGETSVFLEGLNRPHDIVFADVSGRTWVFVAEADRVVRYPYTKGDTKAQRGEVVVDGLPDTSTPELRGQYAHVLKNIAIRENTLYVSIASTCNVCVSDTKSDPQRAAIYRYDASGHNAGRRLFARGIRNAEGLAFVPGTGDLWAVVNNRDNQLVPDDRDVNGDGQSDKGKRVTKYVDEHPLEPFINVRENGFYGWPFCNVNSDKGVRNLTYDRDYELNNDGRAADCASATPVDVGMPAHTAPLGLTFTQGTKAPDLGAVIPLHGSWNSSVPVGYKVIHFPWRNGGPGEQRDLATGWLDESTGRVWGRPVDVAIDTDGSLFVSDDAGGSVVRLIPPPA